MEVVIGVDVGTGSARAGVFTLNGQKLASCVTATKTWRPQADFIQQSSTDIWAAICKSVRTAMAELRQGDVTVRGIGFDATCSLVVLDREGRPLSVDPNGEAEQDIILWADHRAMKEADEINAGQYEVLRYVGGTISPEMETPKLLWLKRNMPDTFSKAGYFFDLPDYLTWRATGSDSRSCCSTVCKWTYLAHDKGWDPAYFEAIGLGDLVAENYKRIGQTVLPLGQTVGNGLSETAAQELGLAAGIPVGVSAIDAHAGGIGVIGSASGKTVDDAALDRSLALIGGTSSCHMAVSRDARYVDGIWGPYSEAMIPGTWLNEAGQSAVGSLVDFVISTHAYGPVLAKKADEEGRTVYELLNERLAELEQGSLPGSLTAEFHVQPDFHGNRSPHADPTLRGMVSGLSLSATFDDLAKLYLGTIQALAYGTRDIIRALNAKGYAIDTIFATGGGTKNPVFLREHANATGCRIMLPQEPDAVLLGSAILGAVAGGAYDDMRAAMSQMTRVGSEVAPDPRTARYHAAKFSVFQAMLKEQLHHRAIMREALAD
ncbi:ribulokinase [Asaia sp. W19]|uniref:FGGY-family carbohydrate kinase n=1 Tax=unclassified Asaia TaxID=2685023 RepID=UPI000F8C61E9|nr:FGGY-family carbohydrate kinase [Asaia sp. W19]RUT25891.1 ribulokinase [Asaia sp. W19]